MATALKHKQRSSRAYQRNMIPVTMFEQRAGIKRQAKDNKRLLEMLREKHKEKTESKKIDLTM